MEAIVAFLALLALLAKLVFGLIVLCVFAFALVLCVCLWVAVFAGSNQVRQFVHERAGTSDG